MNGYFRWNGEIARVLGEQKINIGPKTSFGLIQKACA